MKKIIVGILIYWGVLSYYIFIGEKHIFKYFTPQEKNEYIFRVVIIYFLCIVIGGIVSHFYNKRKM